MAKKDKSSVSLPKAWKSVKHSNDMKQSKANINSLWGLIIGIIMALVILFGAMWTIVITKSIGGKSAKYFMLQQQATGETEGVIEEMINGQKVVKVFNHEEESSKQFDEVNERLFNASFNANRYSNTLMPIINNVNYII